MRFNDPSTGTLSHASLRRHIPVCFFKYAGFLFVSPGMKAAKIVLFLIYALPFMIIFFNDKTDKNGAGRISELCYWIALSVLALFGLCLMCHQDSRYYGLVLPIFSFAAVYGCYYLLTKLVRLGPRLTTILILAVSVVSMANEGFKVPFQQGGDFRYPTIKDNLNVLAGKIKTSDVINVRYPAINKVLKLIKKTNKFQHSAWDLSSFNNSVPGFFLPQRPLVGLWYSNLIHWDLGSGDKTKVLNDFKSADIEWIVQLKNDTWQFTSIDEYATRNIFPKQVSQRNSLPTQGFQTLITPILSKYPVVLIPRNGLL